MIDLLCHANDNIATKAYEIAQHASRWMQKLLPTKIHIFHTTLVFVSRLVDHYALGLCDHSLLT